MNMRDQMCEGMPLAPCPGQSTQKSPAPHDCVTPIFSPLPNFSIKHGKMHSLPAWGIWLVGGRFGSVPASHKPWRALGPSRDAIGGDGPSL